MAPRKQAEIIRNALEQGERSLETLIRQAHCGRVYFHKLCLQYNITLPDDIIPLRYRQELDTLVDEGLKINEIAVRYVQETGKHLSKQAVEQYLSKSGQKAYWKRMQRERREQRMLQEKEKWENDIATLQALRQHLTQTAAEKGWPWEKAVAWLYTKNKPVSVPAFKNAVRLFQMYGTARKQGRMRRLHELAKHSGFSIQETSKILRAVGLPSMCREMHRTTDTVFAEKKERILALVYERLPLTAPDVGYFTGVKESSVNAYIQRYRRSRTSVLSGIKRIGAWPLTHQLDYRTASMLYEARDAGFTMEETREYAGNATEEMAQYAFVHEKEIAPVIVKALQILFPEENITTPYRKTRRPLEEILLQECDPVYHAYRHLPWRPSDTAYFAGVDATTVRKYYKRWGAQINRHEGVQRNTQADTQGNMLKGKNGRVIGYISFRIASQCYQLQDDGIRESDIAGKVQAPPEIVQYVLRYRKKYEREITRGLRLMFPKEKITRPYRG